MRDASLQGEASDELLSAWFAEYGDAVLRMCYVYLRDSALAEDAMQDTFIKAWRGMKGLRGDSSPKTLIMRIAMNTCKDYRRTAWFRHVDRAASAEDMPLARQTVSDESRMLFDELIGLPEKLKQVVLLYHYQNMTLEETAKALGISRAAVSGRLQKAYALLRSHTEKEE